jgi:hypothetical protein
MLNNKARVRNFIVEKRPGKNIRGPLPLSPGYFQILLR